MSITRHEIVNIASYCCSSWVELTVRYLVHPERGQQTKNELYEPILAEFNAAPEQVKFPVSSNR
jgi:hypothetical protein